MEQTMERVRQLRTAIVDVLASIDDIKLQQNPRIEADYQVKIGCWEVQLLEAEIAARRAKRKYALAQAARNRGAQVDATGIEHQLDEEFAEWSFKLMDAVGKYNLAIAFRAGTTGLPAADAKELKHLHRVLVKRLHPDINPGIDAQGRHLFEMVQNGFENGDLELLRSLEVSTRGYAADDGLEQMDEASLAIEAAAAEAQLTVLEGQLEELRKSRPYCLAALLSDPVWVRQRRDEIVARIEEYKETMRLYNEHFEKLKEEGNAA